MWNFQYKHGDRPLAGFTIERAAGRGGFGEVYFAVSDTGRQVALKAVQGYEQIELRGISQCMNLKNPHLVTIFDVRFNDLGKPFVIMEFVGGPSLRQLLDESPSGLGPQKTAFFLREIGKGLSYLHENGIVHRDLKPGNIFYENGYVKIGDYGLSKLIAPMQNSAQTVTVGTVHYMAPEIGAGKYDRSIDIYALGAVVYEMLAGQVPFIGASPTEVLIKHLSTEPDLTGIPEPFATVIKKAMAKDPAQRYQSVQEMVEAVFGTEHIRQSVSVFSPEELSMVAAQATKQVALGSGGNGGSGDFRNAGAAAAVAEGSSAPAGGKAGGANDRFGKWANRFGDRISQAADCVAARGGEIAEQMAAGNRGGPTASRGNAAGGIVDVMDCRNRRILASIVAVFTGFAAQIFAHRHGANDLFLVFLAAWTMVLGGAIGINKAARQLPLKIPGERDKTARHLLTGGLAMLFASIFSAFFWILAINTNSGIDAGGTFLAIVIPLFFIDAAAWVKPDRQERVKIAGCAVKCAVFAGVLSMILHGDPGMAIPIIMGICIAAQLLAPWSGALAEVQQSTGTPMPPKNAGKHAWRDWSREQRRKWREDVRRARYERRKAARAARVPGSFFRGVASLISSILLVAAVALTLALALHIPEALADGLPDRAASNALNSQVFASYPAWPELLEHLGVIAAVLLGLLALSGKIFARRAGGMWHILRGVVGLCLLLAAAQVAGSAFHPSAWISIADLANSNRHPAAWAAFLDGFERPPLIAAGADYILAMLLLAWPPRRQTVMATPAPAIAAVSANAPPNP